MLLQLEQVTRRFEGPGHGAQEVLRNVCLAVDSGESMAVVGPSGAGKSTFIDQLGVNLTASGRRVAVLAVEPTGAPPPVVVLIQPVTDSPSARARIGKARMVSASVAPGFHPD